METKELWGKRMESAHRTGSKGNDISWNNKQKQVCIFTITEMMMEKSILIMNRRWGKPDWMERADRKLRNRAHKKK